MTELPKLSYTLTQAAEAINVSRPTMLRLVNRDDFPAFRSGTRWIIPAESFKNWLDAQATAFRHNTEA